MVTQTQTLRELHHLSLIMMIAAQATTPLLLLLAVTATTKDNAVVIAVEALTLTIRILNLTTPTTSTVNRGLTQTVARLIPVDWQARRSSRFRTMLSVPLTLTKGPPTNFAKLCADAQDSTGRPLLSPTLPTRSKAAPRAGLVRSPCQRK